MIEAALILLGLLGGAVLLARTRTLPSAGSERRIEPRDISVIIPARNEATSLPSLLASLNACRRPPREVIVVDDGSTDGTASIAAAAGATVVHAATPPAGWLGKPWACWTGVQHAGGQHLLFLDADVTLGPDALERLCAAAGPGLLSVQPFHRAGRAYESLSSCFNLVSLMGTGAFAPFQRMRSSIAFGPCVLTSVTDYLAVGGHRAVRGCIVEDAALAARYAEQSLPVRHRIGRGAVDYRMYPDGARSLVDGWTRTLAAGASSARPLPVAIAVAWVAACAATTVRAILWASAGGQGALTPLLYAAVAASTALLLRRIGTFRWWASVAFPVPLAMFLGVFARSVWATSVRRSIVWRSRTISLSNAVPEEDRAR